MSKTVVLLHFNTCPLGVGAYILLFSLPKVIDIREGMTLRNAHVSCTECLYPHVIRSHAS